MKTGVESREHKRDKGRRTTEHQPETTFSFGIGGNPYIIHWNGIENFGFAGAAELPGSGSG
jgi:hypothetical protein